MKHDCTKLGCGIADRLTEDEARAIVAMDKCIPLDPWSEAMKESPGNRSAWANLVTESRKKLGIL